MAGRIKGFDVRAVVFLALGVFASSIQAQNAVRGKQVYEVTNAAPLTCANAGCHGLNPLTNMNNVRVGANNAAAITRAIGTTATNGTVPTMRFLFAYVNAQDAADLAAYIANPAAATAPSIGLSATALSFASTQVGATNTVSTPASITLTNTGAGTLTISGIARTGTNATEFTAGGTCTGASLAPAATCTITASFTPTAAGNRGATFTVQSNAASNPSIALNGTAAAVATPVLTRSATALTYGFTTVGTVSAAQAITVTNSGTVPVTITQASAAPTPEFSASGNCVGTIAAGASCTVSVTFAPNAAGTRAGSLTIVSNAGGSPHTASLTGTGVLTPTPAAVLSATTLSFATQPTGQATRQSTTLTNGGNAPLMISSTSIAGQNAAEFRIGPGNTCTSGALAVAASCRLEIEFMPQTAGGKVATATVAHNAPTGPAAVALAGAAMTPSTTPPAPSSSAVSPSNVGGGGAIGWTWAALLLLATFAATRLRRPAVRAIAARR